MSKKTKVYKNSVRIVGKDKKTVKGIGTMHDLGEVLGHNNHTVSHSVVKYMEYTGQAKVRKDLVPQPTGKQGKRALIYQFNA